MDGTTNIIELKGIGEKSATAFGRLGIRDIDSLITMYPKYYLTYEDPKDIHESRWSCARARARRATPAPRVQTRCPGQRSPRPG